jgi:hypothetical protein
MTPERMAELVARWVRFYTRGLPAPIAERRIDELDADLHDHITHERAHGTEDRRIALSIAARMARGLPADAAWRRGATTMSKSVIRVAAVTAIVLLIPALAMLFTDGTDWGVFDFVFAGVLVAGTGMLLELAARKPRTVAYRVVAAAIGVAAIAFGEADDAPGLVLFGCLLILGAVALTVRTAVRRPR